MSRIRLIHWNEGEAAERAERIRKLGYEVDCDVPNGMQFLRAMRQNPPDAVLIDLDRLPSQGRDVAMAIRHQKSTRLIPIVFVEGDIEKVELIKSALPDAIHTRYNQLRSVLSATLAHPVTQPFVPKSALSAYSGTPLPKKLGIKENAVVALVGAPAGFRESIGEVPSGVQFRTQARGSCDLIIWFIKARRELESDLEKMIERLGGGKLWIAWYKRSSGIKTDVTQQIVRSAGLAAGLVDYKICSIDEIWSGLLFANRRKD